MNRKELVDIIFEKRSVLCVGLDTDLTKIPKHLLTEEDPALAFNKAIIDATKDYTVAYKINTAFYEAQGRKGWECMEETLRYIPKDIFTIADAKRGDIGNTSEQYARTFFQTYPFDSVTVAPYMGADSVKPFLQFEGKWSIVLGLTSNAGSADFQLQQCGDELLYQKVLKTVASWGTPDNIMFVIGATRKEELRDVRRLLPNHFFLVPGVGAQGGDVDTVCRNAFNDDAGVLINVSRGVIYASDGEDFGERAGEEAMKYQKAMQPFVEKRLPGGKPVAVVEARINSQYHELDNKEKRILIDIVLNEGKSKDDLLHAGGMSKPELDSYVKQLMNAKLVVSSDDFEKNERYYTSDKLKESIESA